MRPCRGLPDGPCGLGKALTGAGCILRSGRVTAALLHPPRVWEFSGACHRPSPVMRDRPGPWRPPPRRSSALRQGRLRRKAYRTSSTNGRPSTHSTRWAPPAVGRRASGSRSWRRCGRDEFGEPDSNSGHPPSQRRTWVGKPSDGTRLRSALAPSVSCLIFPELTFTLVLQIHRAVPANQVSATSTVGLRIALRPS